MRFKKGLAALVALVCLAGGEVAFAEKLKITAVEPSTTTLGQTLADGASCTLRILEGTGVLDTIEYTMSGVAGGATRDHFYTNLNLIERMTGVVQRCKDLAGNVSVDSAVRTFTFSDAPRSGSVQDVQIVP
jgi:hypothetical protein